MSPRPAPDPQFLALTGQAVRPSRAKAGQAEPATGGKPKIPRYMREDIEAAHEFRRVVKLLEARSTLTAGDGPLIELHCTLYSRLRGCLAEIKAHGQFESDEYGNRVESAASKLATKLSAQLRQTQIQMGLTPATRSKAGKTSPDPKEAPPVPGSLKDLLRRAAEAIPEQEPEPEDDEPVELDELNVNEQIGEGIE